MNLVDLERKRVRDIFLPWKQVVTAQVRMSAHDIETTLLASGHTLNEVWENPKQSSVFSPAIWRFLQRHHKDGAVTTREEVIRAWQQQGRLGEPGSAGEHERTALIFGPGGTYASTDLRARIYVGDPGGAH